MKDPGEIKTVAVLGCGIIGISWAVLFSRHCRQVRLYNRPSPSLESAKARVMAGLEFLSKERVIENHDVRDAIARVQTFDDLSKVVAEADYVQEALPEDLALKQRVFAEVASRAKRDVVIASSCSSLTLADIARDVTNHPERCIVAHPTNPPHLIPFMEIAGDQSSDEAKETAVHFMEALGQKPILCREVWGYVLNSLQFAIAQQALYLVREGTCSVEGVEKALTEGLGLRWAFTGPFGVYELNAASLGKYLHQYKSMNLQGFRHLGTVSDYDDKFIERIVADFRGVMGGMSHDEYRLWRDHMVVRARKLKDETA